MAQMRVRDVPVKGKGRARGAATWARMEANDAMANRGGRASTASLAENEGLSRRRVLGLLVTTTVMGGSAGFAGVGIPQQALAGPPPSLLDSKKAVQAALKSLESAVVEVGVLRQEVQVRAKLSSSLGAETAQDLRKKLRSGALGDLQTIASVTDDYVGEGELSEIDEKVWGTMLPSDVSGGRTVKVPFGPNEIVCAVLSCVNDPRMVPSTDVVLTRKMLDEGLRMGAASDPRVTPDSILLVIDDLNDKLVAYIDFVKQRARLL